MSNPVVWKKIPVTYSAFGVSGGNMVLKAEDVFISYQDFKEGGRAEMFEVMNVALTGDTRRDDETALYVNDKWMILWGDHRKAYEKVFPDKKKCIALYKKLKPKYGCEKWSTD